MSRIVNTKKSNPRARSRGRGFWARMWMFVLDEAEGRARQGQRQRLQAARLQTVQPAALSKPRRTPMFTSRVTGGGKPTPADQLRMEPPRWDDGFAPQQRAPQGHAAAGAGDADVDDAGFPAYVPADVDYAGFPTSSAGDDAGDMSGAEWGAV